VIERQSSGDKMPQIHVVQRNNRHLYEKYFDPHFRLGHDIYVKPRKSMPLDRPDGREIDQFETTWRSLCVQIGLTNPTLTLQGTDINRQT
jgi:hypothetical protein